MKQVINPNKSGISIAIYVQPGASKTSWSGTFSDMPKLRVQAIAEKGRANKEVCTFIATYFGVPKSAVVIKQGETSRHKTLHIEGDPDLLSKAAYDLMATIRSQSCQVPD